MHLSPFVVFMIHILFTLALGGISRSSTSINEGIETLESDEHPLKAELPMCITEKGIETLESDEYPSKA